MTTQGDITNALYVKEILFADIARRSKAKQQATENLIRQEHLKRVKADHERERQTGATQAGFTITELDDAREIVQNLKKNATLPYRNQPTNWATLYAFLESEQNHDQAHLIKYIKNCDIATQKQDLDNIANELRCYLSTIPNKNNQHYKDLKACYVNIQQNKNTLPPESIALVTATTSRALFKARNPSHPNNDYISGINIARGQATAKLISKQSWGKILGGLLLAALGVTFMMGLPLILTGKSEKKINNSLFRIFKPPVVEKKETEKLRSKNYLLDSKYWNRA